MSRSTYYFIRGRSPRNCWACDGYHNCKCDPVTMRATKRGARVRWDKEIANEIADENDALWDDAVGDYCGDWCPCGDNLNNWIEWLRTREVYPEPAFGVPLIERCA